MVTLYLNFLAGGHLPLLTYYYCKTHPLSRLSVPIVFTGNADIVTVDCASGHEVRTTHVNQKIRKLLAVGSRFALALLPFFDASYRNLIVIDLVEKKVVGGCTVPHSKYARYLDE